MRAEWPLTLGDASSLSDSCRVQRPNYENPSYPKPIRPIMINPITPINPRKKTNRSNPSDPTYRSLRNNQGSHHVMQGAYFLGSSGISVGLSRGGAFLFCTQMPPAYAVFGEIRSGYDARAIGNSMADIDSPFTRGRGPLRAASPLLRNLPSERCSSAHSAGIGFRQDACNFDAPMPESGQPSNARTCRKPFVA